MRVRHQRTAAVIAMILIFSGNLVFAQQGALTDLSVTLSDNGAGARVIYTFNFKTSATGGNGLTGIADNGKIRFVFPSGFDVSGVDIAQSKNSNMTGGFLDPAISGETVELTRDGTGNHVSQSTPVSIAIGLVGNHTTSGSYNVAITTLANNDTPIDAGTTPNFSITSGPLNHFHVVTSGNATAGQNYPITMTAEDEYNNTVTSFSGQASLTDRTGTNTPKLSGAFSNGVRVENLVFEQSYVNNQVTVAYDNKIGYSAMFTVNPGSLAKFSIDPIYSPQTAGVWFTIKLTAQDQYSNTVTGFTNTANISDKSSSITPTVTGNFSAGQWTGQVKIGSTYTNNQITATRSGGAETGVSNNFNVAVGSLDHFVISNVANQTAGSSFNITITAKDSEGNTVTSFAGPVTISDSTGTITPKQSGTFSSGTRTQSVTITGARQNNRIFVSGSGKNGTSNTFNVNPNVLDHFTLSNISSPKTAGQSFEITIEAMDQYKNKITSFTNSVPLSDKTGTISPTVSGNFVAGSRTVAVTITKQVTDNQISATYSGKSGQSNNFNVNPNTVAKIIVRNNPGGMGNEVGALSLNLNNPVVFYAAGYDQWNNYVRDVNANWGRTGTLDLPAPLTGASTTFTPTTPQTSGQIYADSSGMNDYTGTITVGNIHRVIIRDAADGAGNVVNARTITADDTLKLYAAAYDAGDNYLGAAIVNWSSDGTLQPPVLFSNMSEISFSPTTAPTSGRITADHATAIDYTTGIITVNPGAPVGRFTLIPNPGSIPANPDSFSIVTSGTIFDSDGNQIAEGELFTVKTTIGAITSPPDQAPDIAGHQVKSNGQGKINFTIHGNNIGGAAYIHANSARKGAAIGDTTLLISNIEIVSIITDHKQVTRGQGNIPVQMIIKNRGVETATIASDQASLKFKDTNGISRSDNYSVTRADTITVVSGYGVEKTLAFNVDINASAMTDTIAIDGFINATVQGKTVSDTAASRIAKWLVQTPPALRIDRVLASADTVSQGTSATVTTIIRNDGDAALVVDSDSLTFWSAINGDVTHEYAQFPFPSNPDTIKGHSSATFNYTVRVSAVATLDTILLNAKAVGHDVNTNVSYSDFNADFIDGWRVKKATDVKITSFYPSQITVTSGQSRDWYLHLLVRNNGGADLRIDSTQAKFTIGSLDISNQYQVVSPTIFLASGDDTLRAGAIDTLKIAVGQTGTTLGTITIEGIVYLNDMISGQVIDHAVTGIIVQSQAKLTIDEVKTSQPEVTIAQTYPWQIVVGITNAGGSSVAIDSTAFSSFITFVGDTNFVVTPPTGFHAGQNFILDIGETDSLFFTVDTTGIIPGNRQLNVKVSAIEINSQRSILKEKNATIKVEQPANIRILKAENLAPNAPYVDTDQLFKIGVIVQNIGQDAAKDIKISLQTDSLSTILNPVDTLPLVEGGKSDTLLFNIQAHSSWIMSEVFTASLDSAIAQNTPEPDKIIIGLPVDSAATATVQRPAHIKIISVRPSLDTVRALSRNEWQITVAVQDSGAGFIELNPPTASDVGIYIDGVRQTDYSITPPETFKKSGDLILSWWATDTLIYRVTSTGFLGGIGKIKVNLSGKYLNSDTPFARNDSTGIYIRPSADVYVDITEPFNCPNIDQYGIGHVNTNQQFAIRSKIRNAGGERVDNVVVSLTAAGYAIKSDTIQYIPHSSTAWANFTIRAQQTIAERVNFVAKIETATSHESGLPASIGAASDSIASVKVHRPALLKLSFNQSDTLFTSGQLGVVRVNVENLGTADVDSSGELFIKMPFGYVVTNNGQSKSSDTTGFQIGQPITWQVRPPETWSNNDTIIVAISKPPKDRNVGTFASIFNMDPFYSLVVRTIPSQLTVNSFQITAPNGAQDDTLSTFQDFWVQAHITSSENIKTVRAALVLPDGYNFGAGIDSIKYVENNNVSWKLKASTTPHSARKWIKIIASGEAGVNTVTAKDSIGLVTKSQAYISIDRAKITSKEDSTLSTGQEFELSAIVINSGQAKVTGSAYLKISFNTTGITTAEDTLKPFVPNVPVTWRLKAPQTETGWAPITISLETIPFDENTDQPAYAPILFQNLYLKTQHSGYAVIDSVWINSPSGALDGELSTHQTFRVEADVKWHNCADLPWISLQLSSGFTTPESNPKRPSDAGNQGRVSWSIKAPESPIQNVPIWMRLTANDATSGNQFTVKSDSIKVSVVDRARIKFQAEIINPDNAKDGVVSTGQEFQVGAFLSNIGSAKLTGSFSARIVLPEGQGYTIRENATVTAAYHDTIYWNVTAPLYEREAKNIQVLLESSPNDENTSVELTADARINNSAAILIQTEVKSVMLTVFSPRNNVSSAKGDSSVPMLGLEMICSGNVNSNNILLTGVKIKLRDRLNNLILDPSSVISRVAVVNHQSRSIVYGEVTTIPSANPIEILFTRTDTLKPEIPNKIEFRVDILATTTVSDFRLAIDSTDALYLVDESSGLAPKLKNESGQTFTVLNFESTPTVIMESDFNNAFCCFPNPFGSPNRPYTKFIYYLDEDTDVALNIYTLVGELVWSRSYSGNEPQGRKGRHEADIIWDGRNDRGYKVLNGVYIARISTGYGKNTLTKIAVIK